MVKAAGGEFVITKLTGDPDRLRGSFWVLFREMPEETFLRRKKKTTTEEEGSRKVSRTSFKEKVPWYGLERH